MIPLSEFDSDLVSFFAPVISYSVVFDNNKVESSALLAEAVWGRTVYTIKKTSTIIILFILVLPLFMIMVFGTDNRY